MTTSPLLHAELSPVLGAEEDADSSSMGKKHHHAGPEEAVNAVASDVIVFVKKGLDILNFHARGSK